MRRAYFYPTLILCLGLIAALSFHLWFSRTTTVILVRHAEKETLPPGDPSLTAAGRARAEALARAVRDLGVDVVLHSEYERARQTAAPAVRALGVRAIEIPAREIDDLVGRIENEFKGGVVLVVGHSNTVPAILGKLGVRNAPPIADGAYDDLFVVTLYPLGRRVLLHLHYGDPS